MERITMFIQLKFDSEVPIYEQIKQQIKIGMAKGTLQPGERLPSVRQLAKDIGINLHTVNKAYQQLRDENFLLIHRQRGVVIHPDGAPKTDEIHKETLKAELAPIIADAFCREMSENDFLSVCYEIFNEMKGGSSDG